MSEFSSNVHGEHNGNFADVRSASSEAGINLDANANAPITSAVERAVLQALRTGTNPSSNHAGGATSRAVIEHARDSVAALCDGLLEDGVVFTSGCTEANNCIIASARATGAAIITSVVEHPSILEPVRHVQAQGGRVVYLDVDAHGCVDLVGLEKALGSLRGPIILTIQTANSETGVIQPIELMSDLVSQRNDVLFHTDGAQSFGKLRTAVNSGSGPHVISVSGHKLHGPMGVGALLIADGEDRVFPLLRGGEQEGGMRAGTQPLPLIAGFGAACDERAANFDQHLSRMREMRERFERGILDTIGNVSINAASVDRLPNTSSMTFDGVDGMALQAHLDAAGIMASQGSACSSMKPTPSHVLMAMGLSEDRAFSTIRFSVSPQNTPEEIDAAIKAVGMAHRKLSK